MRLQNIMALSSAEQYNTLQNAAVSCISVERSAVQYKTKKAQCIAKHAHHSAVKSSAIPNVITYVMTMVTHSPWFASPAPSVRGAEEEEEGSFPA